MRSSACCCCHQASLHIQRCTFKNQNITIVDIRFCWCGAFSCESGDPQQLGRHCKFIPVTVQFKQKVYNAKNKTRSRRSEHAYLSSSSTSIISSLGFFTKGSSVMSSYLLTSDSDLPSFSHVSRSLSSELAIVSTHDLAAWSPTPYRCTTTPPHINNWFIYKILLQQCLKKPLVCK